MSRRTSRTGALTLSLLLLPGLSLAACSSEQDAGQDPAAHESPTETGEVPGPDALPDGYPEQEAPLLEGEIVSTSSQEADGVTSFNILVAPDTEAASAADEAVARFVETGWKDNTAPESPTHVLVKGADTAIIQSIDGDGSALLSYNLVTQ